MRRLFRGVLFFPCIGSPSQSKLALHKLAKEYHNYSYPRTPFCRSAALRPGGKHVTGFSGRFALLQIQFLCHLKGKREI